MAQLEQHLGPQAETLEVAGGCKRDEEIEGELVNWNLIGANKSNAVVAKVIKVMKIMKIAHLMSTSRNENVKMLLETIVWHSEHTSANYIRTLAYPYMAPATSPWHIHPPHRETYNTRVNSTISLMSTLTLTLRLTLTLMIPLQSPTRC